MDNYAELAHILIGFKLFSKEPVRHSYHAFKLAYYKSIRSHLHANQNHRDTFFKKITKALANVNISNLGNHAMEHIRLAVSNFDNLDKKRT